ncbi:MAG: acetolactate synthase small subunit [Vallitaleaceae bacterium]|jgi:acetolactate synthase-1/3 small subunit|nr:acetolactate synthase small subunit [Vallitaleaceae bacterium]
MSRHVLSVLVSNESGVLSRVAGLFSRRGFNIDSLSVGETEVPSISRMTIVAQGNEQVLDQIEKQLNKLHDVLHIKIMPNDDSVYRELLLIKVASSKETRASIIEIADVFRAKIVDVASESLMIEITGDQSKINAFINLLDIYGIKEFTRTGLSALERGNEVIKDYLL